MVMLTEAKSDGIAKPRVLFVDDEPQLLRMLRLMMLRMPEWDASFVESGQAALALMEQKPFDIVVADMRMPEMNGAQLLNETMKRHPQTFRLILSGYADQDTVFKCVGSTHQFLSKPCSLELLRATLDRLCGLNKGLCSPEFQKIVTQISALPSIPKLYFSIIDALQDPNCSTATIGEIVAEDPGMTSKMLQLVNSAFFGFSGSVSSPAEAVQVLGTSRIRALTLSICVFSAFDEVKFKALSVEQIWNHSVQTAVGAQQIAFLESADDTFVEQAFTAGLLHDVGKLIMADKLPDAFLKVIDTARKEKRPIEIVEREQLGTTHAELGAYLLGLWGMPVPLVAAVAWHHNPERDSSVFCPLTAVHVANSIFNLERLLGCPASPINMDYLGAIGMADRLKDWTSALRTKRS